MYQTIFKTDCRIAFSPFRREYTHSEETKSCLKINVQLHRQKIGHIFVIYLSTKKYYMYTEIKLRTSGTIEATDFENMEICVGTKMYAFCSGHNMSTLFSS